MEKLVESFSGIRGIYGESLTDDVAFKYSYYFSQHISNKVVIGSDGRPNGDKLKDIFIKTFLSFGLEVIDIGNASTPATELAVRHFRADCGVIITASHNEPEYNGWKLLGPTGAILGVEKIREIIELSNSDKIINLPDKKGELKKENVSQIYIEDVLSILGRENIENIRERNFKIVADPNGSPVREILEGLFKFLNIDLVGVNMEEGIYNRKIEPTHETLEYLIEIIKENDADFGFGLDGDADRIELVLKDKTLSGNEVLGMGIESILINKEIGQTVVVNNATSNLIDQIVQRYEGVVKRVDVGETNIVTEMEKLNSPIGGEGSNGGIIISPTKCRDGILSLCLILSLLSNTNKTIEEMIDSYPNYYEKRIKAKTDKKDMREYLINKLDKVITYPGDVSGITLMYNENSWLFFRESQTEPGLWRIIANGDNKDLVNKMIEDGESIFNQ